MIIDQVVSEVEGSGKGKLCARVHDGVMFTNVRIEPAKLVQWINKRIREKLSKGTIIGSASATSKPAVPVFAMTIVDEEWFKQENKVPYAQAVQWDKKDAWRKCGSCGRRVAADEQTDKCTQCVKDWEAAEKMVKSAECFTEIETATLKYTASSMKCPCGQFGIHVGCQYGISFYPEHKATIDLWSRIFQDRVSKRVRIRELEEAKTAPVTKYESGRWVTVNTKDRVRAPRRGIYEDAIVEGKVKQYPDMWELTFVSDGCRIREDKKKLIVTTPESREAMYQQKQICQQQQQMQGQLGRLEQARGLTNKQQHEQQQMQQEQGRGGEQQKQQQQQEQLQQQQEQQEQTTEQQPPPLV